MNKKRVHKLFEEETKRKNKIIKNSLFILALTLVIVLLSLFYLHNNKTEYVSFKEKGNVDYQVYLRDNTFFNNSFLGKDNQYISNIVDYIKTTYNYNLSMDMSNINYNYKYNINASLNIVDTKEKKVLYNYEEKLVNDINKSSNGKNTVNITQNINIDYNKYNALAKKFITTYDLTDVDANLVVSLNVNVNGSCEDLEKNSKNQSSIELTIPLNKKTFSIEESNDIADGNENILACKKINNYFYILIFIILLVIIDIILIVRLYIYIVKTKSAEAIYNSELKKILNSYGSYIQKVNNEFQFKNYQVLRVDSFEDMLEIRDTVQEPILMIESKYNKGAYFVIPSGNKILYSYGLKVSDIKKKIKLENKEIL